MKKKIILSIAVLLTLHLVAAAQMQFHKNSAVKPLVSEYEIESIDAHEGIDLLLLDGDHNDGLSAAVEDGGIKKIRIEVLNGKLRISKQQGLPPDERISVYISINGTKLRSLRLFGDAFATSRGILDQYGMDVQLNDNAQVALRTKGKLLVQAPSHFRMYKEENFYSVYSMNR